MYSCCAQKGSVQPITSISINTFLLRITLYWQDHYVLTYTDVSPEPSFHGAIITSSDISKCSQPSCTTGKPLTPPRGEKNCVDLRDETSLTTMLFGVASWAGCLEPRLALATPPLVLMRNHHSPLHLNVSLQPRRRHNFAAYMGPLTSKRALLREK